METISTISIGLGLIIRFLFSEFLGIAAGGMVVPGYIALQIHKPLSVLATIGTALITYIIVLSMSQFLIIYGRRRTLFMILVGFIIGWILKFAGSSMFIDIPIDLTIVGYIIPGLIAIWMDRQGVLETVTTLITSSIIVRLILILIFGRELI
jgi:poly-gamma-glutamate biosynthesis protein PgsC/CapC